MLYSGAMNRVAVAAVVFCVILFVLAVLIAPTIDLQPSALRAQQWLNLIAAMFSLAALFEICLQVFTVRTVMGSWLFAADPPQQVSSLDLSCCMLC